MDTMRRFVSTLTAFVMAAALVPAPSFAEEPAVSLTAPSTEEQTQPGGDSSDPSQGAVGGASSTGEGGQQNGDTSAQTPGDQDSSSGSPSDGQEAAPGPSTTDPASTASTSADTPAATTLGAPAPEQHDFGEGYGVLSAIPIKTAEELAKIGVDEAYPLSGNYFLSSTGAIFLTNSFTALGTNTEGFSGKFDGCGQQVSFTLSGGFYANLFQCIAEGGLVENVEVRGNLNSQNYTSSIAYENRGTIRGIHVDANIGSDNDTNMNVAGIAAYNSGIIEDCTVFSQTLIGGAGCAGIALHCTGRITNCENNARVGSAQTMNAAGIVLAATGEGIVEDCKNTGKVSSALGSGGSLAGIVASAEEDASIRNCVNTGAVANFDRDFVGGIVGETKKRATVEYCENSGTISGEGAKAVGGIAGAMGDDSSFIGCTNKGYEVTGEENVGGVVGKIGASVSVDCIIRQCINEASVKGSENVGGVVGQNNCGVMDCKNSGDVYGTHKNTGGVIGDNALTGNAQGLVNYGLVQGCDNVGGVVGSTTADQVNVMVDIGLSHSLGVVGNYGTVRASGQNCGGVVGYANGHFVDCAFNQGDVYGNVAVGGVVGCTHNDFTSCYNTGDVEGTSSVGGLAGYEEYIHGAVGVKDSYTTGRVKGTENVGALMGTRFDSTSICYLTDMYYNTDYTGDLPPFGNREPSKSYDRRIEGRTTEEMLGKGMTDELQRGDWEFIEQFDDVAGEPNTKKFFYPQPAMMSQMPEGYIDSAERPGALLHNFESETLSSDALPDYEVFTYIENEDDLAALDGVEGGNYVLAANINLYGADPLPTLGGEGSFDGKLDGAGHTIHASRSSHGLVQKLTGQVMNLTLEGDIDTNDKSPHFVGGFAHEMGDGGALYRCTNRMGISGFGSKVVGGLAGQMDGESRIISCKNQAFINVGNAADVGGIVGKTSHIECSLVEDCVNSGVVTATGQSTAGGIVGTNYLPQIEYAGRSYGLLSCTNEAAATVSGSSEVGGIAGYSTADVIGCSNAAKVGPAADDAAVWSVGGIVGELMSARVSDCVNTGEVAGGAASFGHDAGGIVGSLTGDDMLGPAGVLACRNEGAVTGGQDTGGLVGCAEGSTTSAASSSNAGAVSGAGRAGGLVGSVSDTGTVDSCFNAGCVSGGAMTGGLVGKAERLTLRSSSNLESVTGASDLGGLVGYLGNRQGPTSDYYRCEISDCSSIGTIGYAGAATDPVFVGGLVGRVEEGLSMARCFGSGLIEGDALPPGAVAGLAFVDREANLDNVRDCYYNTDFCDAAGLVYTDGSAFDDAEAFFAARNLSGRTTAAMTGSDVLTAEGKMTALAASADAAWTARESDSMEEQWEQGVWFHSYYPQQGALPEMGAPWKYEKIVQPYERQVSSCVRTYMGGPIAYDVNLYNGTPYTVRYVGNSGKGTSYPLSDTPPTKPGEYYALITFDEAQAHVSYKLQYAELSIEKKRIEVTVDDVVRRVGEENPPFTFSSGRFCGNDDFSVIDEATWECEATPDSPTGTYPITLRSVTDDCYEAYASEAGTLTVEQDDARDFFEFRGQTGVDGFEDWHIGPVSLFPTGRYDLISAGMINQQITWSDSLVINSKSNSPDREQTIMVKDSQTGAETEKATITFNYGAPLRLADYNISPARGATIKPEMSLINLQYTTTLAFRESGEYRVYVNGLPLYTFTAADMTTGRVEIDNTHSTQGIKSGEIELHIGESLPPHATVCLVALSTEDEWGPVRSLQAGAPSEPFRENEYVYYTKGYTANIDLPDQVVTYDGTPRAVVPTVTLNAENVPRPSYTVAYEGAEGTAYEKSETPPTHPGTYTATVTVDDENFEPASATCTLTIEKKPLTVKADDKARLTGEENPAFTFTAEGLVAPDSINDLDEVAWTCAATPDSPAGVYDIALAKGSDDIYDIAPAAPAGTLTVGQDSAAGRFSVRGEQGANGHDDWYVGEVTVAPDGRDGYDLVSDDGGATWHSALTYASDDEPQTVQKSILLKKSSTGAFTSAEQLAFNLFTKPLAVTSLAPENGAQYCDPAGTVLELAFDQPVEKGRGSFTVSAADGSEFAQLNVRTLRVGVSEDGMTVKLRLPDSFEPYGTYTVTCNAGALCTQTYGKPFDGLSAGAWTFTVSGSSDTVSISDLELDVEGEAAPRRAIYVGRTEADYAAALVPGEDGRSALSITPKTSGVLADDRIKLETLAVVMMDGSSAPADAVIIDGKHLVLADGVKSALVNVTAYGQQASDSATIMLMSTGWAAAVVDNQTGLSIRTSNLLEAINPFDLPLLGENQIARATLTIKPLPEENVSEAERALLREGADGSVLGGCLSIELVIDVFEKDDPASRIERKIVHVTERPIVFSVKFEDDGVARANERMLRVHDGAVDALRMAILADGTRVFASDMFSTYAPAYDILRTVTVEKPEHGTLSVDKMQAVKGETVSATAVPDEGYRLDEIRVDGSAIEGSSFTMPDADVTVSAVFSKRPGGLADLLPAPGGRDGGGAPAAGAPTGVASTGDPLGLLILGLLIAAAGGSVALLFAKRRRR